MRATIKYSCLLLAALLPGNPAFAVDVNVSGLCNIYGAGHPNAPANAPTVGSNGGGIPPVAITLSALGSPGTLTLSASGTVSYCTLCGPGGPDGSGNFFDLPGYNGISGVTNWPVRSLTAVFVSDIEPVNPPPASLDFLAIGLNYTNLSPLLNQQFFIGDGLNNLTGKPQIITVPAGATHLCLGFADGFSYTQIPDGYNDNSGSLSVTVLPVDPALAIKHSTSGFTITVTGPVGSTNRVEYTPALPATNWTLLTNVVMTTTPMQVFDTNPPAGAKRFYRAVNLP